MALAPHDHLHIKQNRTLVSRARSGAVGHITRFGAAQAAKTAQTGIAGPHSLDGRSAPYRDQARSRRQAGNAYLSSGTRRLCGKLVITM